MKNKKSSRRQAHSSKKGARKKGVSDRAGNYDLDGISQDDNFDVIVASEKNTHARHPHPSLATYFKNLKTKVTELFKH